MKKLKKIIALLIAVIIAMLFLGSCSKKSGSGFLGKGKKPESVKFMINVGITVDDGALEWGKEFERLTGIKLDGWNGPLPNNDYYTKIDLAFSANQAPDVFNIGDGRLPFYAAQGALADITELVEKSDVLSKIDPELLELVKVNGKFYGIPFEYGSGNITMVRQDWLDECGLKAPTTYDEFINMLRAFKAKHPDCIPYIAPSLYQKEAVLYVREFYQDATPEFTKVNGKWVDGLLQDNMKPALQRLQDAYGEGLIDQEVITNTTSTCRDKWYAGKVGVFTYWVGFWAMNLEKRLQANVPTAKVLQLPAIKETKYLQRFPVVTAISSTCKNISGVFKYFIEYMHDGKEGQLLFESGVKGQQWKQEGNKLVYLPKKSKPQENYDKAYIAPFLRVTPLNYKDKNIDWDPRVLSSIKILNDNDVHLPMIPISKAYTKIASDLIALRTQIIGQIVMGKISVEDGLAKYKKESESLGVNEVLVEMNQ